ncbi:MAG: CBS domain-containing protein [Acidobacteria bacterium]|nr:MAG: CBS domain-containing protein [Acidobacteriota bacterium]
MGKSVAELMTREVVVVSQDQEIHEAERLCLRHGVHGLPVVDAGGRPVGVISQTDILNWHFGNAVDGTTFYGERPLRRVAEAPDLGALRLSDIRSAPISEVMTPLVHAIRPEAPASEAAELMIRLGVHRLVVVDADGRLAGIVSALDLLREIPGVSDRIRAGGA